MITDVEDMNIHTFFGILFAILAFVSGIVFLIRSVIDFSGPAIALGIGSILTGFGFIAVINEEKIILLLLFLKD